jgi:hypothetical protein
LQSLRTQIEAYKAHHMGKVPNGFGGFNQLSKPTNLAGAVSPTGLPTAEHRYGPYRLGPMPAQPFSGSITVRAVSGTGTPAATPAPGGGWIYRASTGEIWVDHPDYVQW